MEFIVIESNWSGWKEGYKPKEIKHTYTVEKGKEYNVGEIELYSYWEYTSKPLLSFKITKVLKDGFIFKTTNQFCENHINFFNTKSTFTLKNGTPLKLLTPTHDCGDIFTFLIPEEKSANN